METLGFLFFIVVKFIKNNTACNDVLKVIYSLMKNVKTLQNDPPSAFRGGFRLP